MKPEHKTLAIVLGVVIAIGLAFAACIGLSLFGAIARID